MDRNNIYYKAFQEYRKYTKEDKSCLEQRKSIIRPTSGKTIVDIVTYQCRIDNDWIDEIEGSLNHIDKAIQEQREFIQSYGEIVPIEKVKGVSKETVSHLAKHSNLVTKVQDSGDIIPDKLYNMQRESDFAVYENRFLYMLLHHLNDFVSYRYGKILEKYNNYNGQLKVDKKFGTANRVVSIKIELSDERKNDGTSGIDEKLAEQIKRIKDILSNITAMLNTPLMKLLDKVAMLKPPITETNILKMNQNFNGALKLYYYLTSYDKEGFSIKEVRRSLAPLSADIEDEYAEAYEMLSFLTFINGAGIKKQLKEQYERDLESERFAERQKMLDALNAIREKIKGGNVDVAEYIRSLEERNKSLENDGALLIAAKRENEGLNRRLKDCTEKIAELQNTVSEQNKERDRLIKDHAAKVLMLQEKHEEKIENLMQTHRAEMEDAEREHQRVLSEKEAEYESSLSTMKAEHAAEVETLKTEHAEAVERLNSEHAEAVSELNFRHAEEVRELNAAHEKEVNNLTDERNYLEEQNDSKAAEITKLNGEYAELLAKKRVSDATVNAVRHKEGTFTDADDFTTYDAFSELEEQYDAFKQFFKQEWKKTKKRIRKENLVVFDENGDGDNDDSDNS